MICGYGAFQVVEKPYGARVQKKATGKLIGYARVSTEDQNLTVQLDALKAAGCWNTYQEKRSATRGPRPQLDLALMDLRPGDTLVVYRLDRLIRHARDLYRLLDVLEEKQASVKSLTEPHLDILTPVGEFMMGMTALLAQIEVRTTAKRTSAGIAAIKARGGSYGAKPRLSDARAGKMLAALKAGASKVSLAKQYGLSPASVTNYAKRAKIRRKK